MTMADTIAVMHEAGSSRPAARPSSTSAPQTEFVANFLGVSNLVDAPHAPLDNGLAAAETHDGATLRVPSARAGADGGAAADRRAAGEGHALPRRRRRGRRRQRAARHGPVAWFLGVSIQYVVRTAGGEELTVFAQNLDGAEPDSLGPGREVQLAWDPQHTFVVPKEGP